MREMVAGGAVLRSGIRGGEPGRCRLFVMGTRDFGPPGADLGLVPQVFYYENQAETEGMIVGQLPDPQTVVPSGSDVAIIEVARSAAEDQEIAPEP